MVSTLEDAKARVTVEKNHFRGPTTYNPLESDLSNLKAFAKVCLCPHSSAVPLNNSETATVVSSCSMGKQAAQPHFC
jgi:hypothetical protein